MLPDDGRATCERLIASLEREVLAVDDLVAPSVISEQEVVHRQLSMYARLASEAF